MRYAVIVLVNNRNPLSSVDFFPVTDALLEGGIFADETLLLPYDAPASIASALSRLTGTCDAVFFVCDEEVLHIAREVVSASSGKTFSEEYLLETEECLYAVLPAGERGAAVVKAETVSRVDRRRRNSYCRIVMRTVGAPPEKIRETLAAAEEVAQGRLVLHFREKYANGRIELLYDRETPKMLADEVVRVIASGLSDFLYSMNDESIAQRLVDALKLHRMRISTAESFTGGGVGRAIVQIPGASEVFYEGLNTYSSGAKRERLGVSEETLSRSGAVSDETVYEMASGLIAGGKCDIAVATTGIAGPSSDDSGAPVGLCYFAVGTRERVRVFRFHLAGDRQEITETAIQIALFLAFREIR